MRALVVLVLAALLLASCTQQTPDTAKIKTEVQALLDKSAAEMSSGVIDTTMAQYADDPYSLPNNGPLLHGKAAIKEYFGKMMAMGMKFKAVKFTNLDVTAAGKYVNDIGTYEMTMEIPGMGTMNDKGKYVTIYERAADGKLKIKYETWNNDTMPSMPEPQAPAGEKKM